MVKLYLFINIYLFILYTGTIQVPQLQLQWRLRFSNIRALQHCECET